jgi:hypothetical protein
MFAGDVGRASDGGLHIAQSAVRSRNKDDSYKSRVPGSSQVGCTGPIHHPLSLASPSACLYLVQPLCVFGGQVWYLLEISR